MLLRFFFLFVLPASLAAQVQPSLLPGRHPSPIALSLSLPPSPPLSLHITLDGRAPTLNDPVYTAPISIQHTTALRATAFDGNGQPTGHTFAGTYFIGTPDNNFGVASLIVEPAAFANIYTQYNDDLTAAAWLEWLEPGVDSVALSQWVEIEIQGGASAAQAQKSIELAAKKALGHDVMAWPFFPDLPFQQYERLVLRNGGQDWMVTQCRDELATSIVGNLAEWKDVLRPPAMDLQAWRPTVLYVNGQYQGIHTLRERMNRFYVQQHYDLKKHQFDLIERYNTSGAGDALAWENLQQWLLTHHCDNDDNYQYLSEQVDMQHYIDYCLFQVFIDNQDWPGNNNRRWRERAPGGQWRWLLYDLDLTMGLLQLDNNGWNTGDAKANALARLLDSTKINLPNPDWSTLLFRRCWENAQFRRAFANRSADCLNTIFQPAHLNRQLDWIRDQYQPEIARHYERWWLGDYTSLWLSNIETIRKFCQNRTAQVFQHYKTALGEQGKLATIRVDVYPPDAGTVRVNSISLTPQHLPWMGKYFTSQAVELEARPNAGWHFIGWQELDLNPDTRLATTLNSGSNYRTAVFSSDVERHDGPEKAPIVLSPNPVADVLSITLQDVSTTSTPVFEVYDALGRLMSVSSWATATPGVFELTMGHLPGGCYWVALKGGKGVGVVKR